MLSTDLFYGFFVSKIRNQNIEIRNKSEILISNALNESFESVSDLFLFFAHLKLFRISIFGFRILPMGFRYSSFGFKERISAQNLSLTPMRFRGTFRPNEN